MTTTSYAIFASSVAFSACFLGVCDEREKEGGWRAALSPEMVALCCRLGCFEAWQAKKRRFLQDEMGGEGEWLGFELRRLERRRAGKIAGPTVRIEVF
jgi:hypothetical protein